MKKFFILVLCVVALTVFAAQTFAEYDKEKVVAAMKENGANMGKLKKIMEAEERDFFAAAEALMTIAKNMKSLDEMTPEEGSKEEWDKNHSTLIKAAFKGIGACGEEDAEKLGMAIGEIGKLIKEGHGMFKE